MRIKGQRQTQCCLQTLMGFAINPNEVLRLLPANKCLAQGQASCQHQVPTMYKLARAMRGRVNFGEVSSKAGPGKVPANTGTGQGPRSQHPGHFLLRSRARNPWQGEFRRRVVESGTGQGPYQYRNRPRSLPIPEPAKVPVHNTRDIFCCDPARVTRGRVNFGDVSSKEGPGKVPTYATRPQSCALAYRAPIVLNRPIFCLTCPQGTSAQTCTATPTTSKL